MNGCDTHRFLVRWRTLGLPVVSAVGYVAAKAGEGSPVHESKLGQLPASASG